MALVAFLRGVNVGGHRAFRPKLLAEAMVRYGVVNIGAAGTFVIRRHVAKTKLKAEFARRLPFETHIMICEGREILALAKRDPFRKAPKGAGLVRFVSVMAKRSRRKPTLPLQLPKAGAWRVKLIAIEGPFAFGLYRRHMQTIGYLGQLDKLIGVPVTVRNWNTVASIIKVLQGA